MAQIKAVKKTFYQCTVCGVKYDDREEAEKRCGSHELEPAVFKVGDRVKFDWRGNTEYGVVVEVIGPIVGGSFKDGRRRIGKDAHVYRYGLKSVGDTPLVGAFYFWTAELEAA